MSHKILCHIKSDPRLPVLEGNYLILSNHFHAELSRWDIFLLRLKLTNLDSLNKKHIRIIQNRMRAFYKKL